jgi:uncharacterized protein (TIGR02301 family)
MAQVLYRSSFFLTPMDNCPQSRRCAFASCGRDRDRRARFGDNSAMSRPFLIGVFLSAFLAVPVLAQERDASERQRLLDIAYALGESHALRQACQGEGDQYWRARMVRMTEVEQADQAFDAQMRERFNTGFASRRSEFPTCDDASRKAEQQAARRGQALARKLSQSVRQAKRPAPDSVAEEESAR